MPQRGRSGQVAPRLAHQDLGERRVHGPAPGPARASAGTRRRRLRPVSRRRAVRLSAGRGGGRCRARGYRRGARGGLARLDATAALSAAAARLSTAALFAHSRRGERSRREALQADRRAARGERHCRLAPRAFLSRPAAGRRPRRSGSQLEPDAYRAAARPGRSTVSNAARMSPSAAYSAHAGRSPRTRIPHTTPTTGMSSMLIENTLTGTEVAILIHAQWANANAIRTL